MPRRVHVQILATGEITLDAAQAHHLRDVLRLEQGESVELFDDSGAVASGEIIALLPECVTVRVNEVDQHSNSAELVVASAVPKGDRADWMVEKLSELGVTRFIPLQTERSVVHPTGTAKRDRWMRIATESAKQSRRAGVMQIDALTTVQNAVGSICDTGLRPMPGDVERRGGLETGPLSHGPEARVTVEWFLSTNDDAISARDLITNPADRLFLFIGPEGGWTDGEIALFKSHNLTGVKLTATILRVETAAIAAAAIAATLLVRR